MKTLTATLLLVIVGLLSVCNTYASEEDAKKGRECLFAKQPSDWKVLDDENLILWGPSQRDAYLVKLFAPVHGLRFAIALGIIDDDRNGMICGNSTDKIFVRDTPAASFPTNITSMRKVDDAELLALGEKYNVKLLSKKKMEELKSHDKQIHD